MDRTSWKWYEVLGHEGHQGSKRSREVKLYIFASDSIHALNKYKKINRIKSRWRQDIRELSEQESSRLVKEILTCRRPNFTIGLAKRYYYLSKGSYEQITST